MAENETAPGARPLDWEGTKSLDHRHWGGNNRAECGVLSEMTDNSPLGGETLNKTTISPNTADVNNALPAGHEFRDEMADLRAKRAIPGGLWLLVVGGEIRRVVDFLVSLALFDRRDAADRPF
jgi:hypothetical protein